MTRVQWVCLEAESSATVATVKAWGSSGDEALGKCSNKSTKWFG